MTKTRNATQVEFDAAIKTLRNSRTFVTADIVRSQIVRTTKQTISGASVFQMLKAFPAHATIANAFML